MLVCRAREVLRKGTLTCHLRRNAWSATARHIDGMKTVLLFRIGLWESLMPGFVAALLECLSNVAAWLMSIQHTGVTLEYHSTLQRKALYFAV